MAALLHRKPASAKTSYDSCSANDSGKRNTVYKTVMLPAGGFLNRCETWSVVLREECTLRISEQDTEQNTWIQEGGSNRRLKKTTY